MDIDREKEGKCLTVTVPCYNSESYLERCVESLLKERDGLEIILVDDGSTDRTGQLADQYARAYPDVVRVVHKKNGGHGSGVNAGLMLANGIYFKVVDSDDWLDEAAFHKLMSVLRFWCRTKEEKRPDLVVCNYVYDHLEEGKTKAVRYGNLFPEQKICRWDEIGCFSPEQYLVMHALIFRTGVLYDCGLKLPEHTFYVDNLFANCPLPFVQRIYYLNEDLYHYYLGREDQSVNEKVLVSHRSADSRDAARQPVRRVGRGAEHGTEAAPLSLPQQLDYDGDFHDPSADARKRRAAAQKKALAVTKKRESEALSKAAAWQHQRSDLSAGCARGGGGDRRIPHGAPDLAVSVRVRR